MTTLVLATVATTVVTILLVGVSVMLMGLILLQKNRGSGISGAFGGVGGHTAFGTKTGDFLTWVTVAFTAFFLLLSVIGVYVFVPTKVAPAPTPQISAEGSDQSGLPAEEAPTDMAPVSTGGAATPPSGNAAPAQPTSPPPAGSTTPPATSPGGTGQ